MRVSSTSFNLGLFLLVLSFQGMESGIQIHICFFYDFLSNVFGNLKIAKKQMKVKGKRKMKVTRYGCRVLVFPNRGVEVWEGIKKTQNLNNSD